ncbi:MAG: L,D-transpeptidase [Chloroflexota bacterium]|nr:L,D-transpeptidase [Chloroflexota bacterium]
MEGIEGSAAGPHRTSVRRARDRRVTRTARLSAFLCCLLVLAALLGAGPSSAQEEPAIVPIEAGADPEIEQPAIVPEAESAVLAPQESGAEDRAPGGEDWAPPRTVYVPETGQTVDGVFLDLWRGWGAANGFGNPITPEIEEDGRLVQYYGYARLEYWPEDPDGRVVRFGDIGSEMRPHFIRRGLPGNGEAATAAARVARAWLPMEAGAAEPDSVGWRYMPETGHGVAGDFKAFWEATGDLTFLGNPLSQPYDLGGVTYQVFERGMIAQEPGGSPYLVPAGELAAARRGLDTSPVAQVDAPTYSEDLFVPPPDPTPTPADSPGEATVRVDPNAEKWFEVSIGQQYGIARQGDVILWEGYLSTGKPDFDTPTGTFFVNTKLPEQDMEGVIGGEYYNVPAVPSVMYFTDRGHAIHGTYWHANFGTPMSHGCINLPMDVAAWLYDWAPIGLRVEIVP